MGLTADYPAVTMNDPNGHVTVYNEQHVPIGVLGPPPFESSSVNVTCRLVKWEDEPWYRLLSADGWDFPARQAYVSALETHPLNPGEPYDIPECRDLSCVRRATPLVATIGGVAASAAWWRRRRRAP